MSGNTNWNANRQTVKEMEKLEKSNEIMLISSFKRVMAFLHLTGASLQFSVQCMN